MIMMIMKLGNRKHQIYSVSSVGVKLLYANDAVGYEDDSLRC